MVSTREEDRHSPSGFDPKIAQTLFPWYIHIMLEVLGSLLRTELDASGKILNPVGVVRRGK